MSAANTAKIANATEAAAQGAPRLDDGWGLLLKGAPDSVGEQSGLPTSPASGLDCSENSQARAAKCFKAIIDPITNPEKYAELQKRFGSRGELVRHVAAENGISPRTIYRLHKAWKSQGIIGMARKLRADRGKSRIFNNAALEFLLSAYLPKEGSYGELSVKDVYRVYEEELRFRAEHSANPVCPGDREKYRRYLDAEGRFVSAAQFPEASYRTFCREVYRIPELLKKMARGGDEAYRNGELISFRDLAAPLPLDIVVMDHRVLDIFCMVPERRAWKLARPWLTAAIDMRTRKWLAWVIVETPSSDSIASVLKQVFINHGLPKALYWDNGKDFRCRWLEGRTERTETVRGSNSLPTKWAGVLETLGIRVHHAIVKNARAKLIEPAFNTVADFDRTLPEWTGNKPGTRPEGFGRMLKDHEAWLSRKLASPPFRTIEQVAALYTLKLREINEREHRGEGMRKETPAGYGWRCPNEIWEILIRKVERRTVPEEILQLCFAKRRELTVRNGEIQATFGGRLFHYRLVADSLVLLRLNGRKVELAYDPLDLAKAAVYYEAAFIGLAECCELRRQGEQDYVQDERDRRFARREVKKFISAVHQAVPVADPETQLRRRQEVLPSRIEPERPETAVALPAAIEAAASARAEEKEFSFADVRPLEAVAIEGAADDDGEFRFFTDRGGL